jgi:hypothetical protein
MYFLTIISLFLFIPSLIFSEYNDFLLSISKYFEQTSRTTFYSYNANIFIYTIPNDFFIEGLTILKRNSGPFWEAGGFASFLMVALLASITLKGKVFNRKNLVFIIAIITTYSTPAFIGLAVIFLGYGIWIVRNKYVRLFSPLLIILLSYQAFTNLNFMSERIRRSLVYYQKRESAKYEKRDRMISAIVDLRTFRDYPIFGTGRQDEGRYGSSVVNELRHRNNGVTDFLVKYGLLFLIFYFYMVRKTYISFSSQNILRKKIWGNIALMAILIIGFSQILFQMSVFIAIFYCSIFTSSEGYLANRISLKSNKYSIVKI